MRQLRYALIPTAAPAADKPFEHLGESFEISGGYIRNALLRAAFDDADARMPIDTNCLVRAAFES